MGSWIKIDTDFATNAKIGQAGPNGDRLFLVMLLLHAKHGGGGKIPASRCTPAGLRIEASAVLGRLSEKAVAKAIDDCIAADLLARDDDGSMRLCGFDEGHMPECSRCHRPNPEPGQSTCPTCREEKRLKRQGGIPRAEKGMPSSAPGQRRVANSLLDRTGQDGMGQEGMGLLDGSMDGRSCSYQDQKGGTDQPPVPGRLAGSAPLAAGDVAKRIVARHANGNGPTLRDRRPPDPTEPGTPIVAAAASGRALA
jgi:hypothetical protein